MSSKKVNNCKEDTETFCGNLCCNSTSLLFELSLFDMKSRNGHTCNILIFLLQGVYRYTLAYFHIYFQNLSGNSVCTSIACFSYDLSPDHRSNWWF